jgi:arabinose-5-phosphate isomerase
MKSIGENVVRIEAEALRALADRIAGPMAVAFERAVEMLHACTGRVVVTGMGKSGIIARKIAATLSSTGTPAMFMHPAEAIHGDLGMLVRGDVVIALSASGETEEILHLLATIKRLPAKLISMTGDPVASARQTYPANSAKPGSNKSGRPAAASAKPAQSTAPSTLAAAADVALDCSIAQEACSLGLAPTASTTTMLALGDALAMAIAHKRGFKEEDFADLHPGGKLGKKLSRARQLMHSGDAMPQVSPQTRMSDVIYEMSRKGLGLTTVVRYGKLLGIISDGDLRRQLEKHGRTPGSKDVLELTAEDCMTRNPRTILPDEFALSALNIMEQKKITALVVVDEAGAALGILHLHDLWGIEAI